MATLGRQRIQNRLKRMRRQASYPFSFGRPFASGQVVGHPLVMLLPKPRRNNEFGKLLPDDNRAA